MSREIKTINMQHLITNIEHYNKGQVDLVPDNWFDRNSKNPEVHRHCMGYPISYRQEGNVVHLKWVDKYSPKLEPAEYRFIITQKLYILSNNSMPKNYSGSYV